MDMIWISEGYVKGKKKLEMKLVVQYQFLVVLY